MKVNGREEDQDIEGCFIIFLSNCAADAGIECNPCPNSGHGFPSQERLYPVGKRRC